MKTKFISVGSLFALFGVALGAFGAHGLKDHIAPELMEVYRTGVQYHLIHAMGLIAVGLVMEIREEKRLCRYSGFAMGWGIVLFSGSLYLLAITGIRWLGMITPIGGMLFLAAWILLAMATWKSSGT